MKNINKKFPRQIVILSTLVLVLLFNSNPKLVNADNKTNKAANNRISYNSINDCYFISDYTNTTNIYSNQEFQYLKDTWSYIGDTWAEHIIPMFTNNELKQFISNKKYNYQNSERMSNVHQNNYENSDADLNKSSPYESKINQNEPFKNIISEENVKPMKNKTSLITSSDIVIIY